VPATLGNGAPFLARQDIVFVTAGVIVLTLLVQGPLLPTVVRWARLPDDTTTDDELQLAELAITTTAVAALPELANEDGISQEVHARLSRDYQEHLSLVEAKKARTMPPRGADARALEGPRNGSPAGDGGIEPSLQTGRAAVSQHDPLARNEEYTRLRLAVIDRKQEVLNRLRREGTVDDSVARRVQTRLDLEKLRLNGVDPLE
jgi:monovalent cation/hydrogen antiporter